MSRGCATPGSLRPRIPSGLASSAFRAVSRSRDIASAERSTQGGFPCAMRCRLVARSDLTQGSPQRRMRLRQLADKPAKGFPLVWSGNSLTRGEGYRLVAKNHVYFVEE